MSQDKGEKLGVKKPSRSRAKMKNANQRAKKKLSATLLSILDTEDGLSEGHLGLVPRDVREWLIGTFTTKVCKVRTEEKAVRRVISETVEGSHPLIREFRTSVSSTGIAYPPEVIAAFKDVDEWVFDVFALNEASQGHSLKYVMCEMFNKYDLLSRFQIPFTILISFVEALEVGYNKHHNTYHNAAHAADVTQTVHSILFHTGTMHWFTDLEILAIFFSAAVHDYEHTGTTNSFHVQTKSDAALLYNDASVLENHHLSAAYQLVQNPDLNILANLTEEEWREMRQMVIKIILATDMASHSQHMKNTLHELQQHERLHKSMVMPMIVHVADISHPAKSWELHYRWSQAIMEEFFKQGAMEAQLGLPISPLCDRVNTNIAASQIGFIDVIIKPVFSLLFEIVKKTIIPVLQKAAAAAKEPWYDPLSFRSKEKSGAENTPTGSTLLREWGPCTNMLSSLNIPGFKGIVMQNIEENRNHWKDMLEPKKKESPEKESNKAKEHVHEQKAQKEKILKSEDKAQKEKTLKSEDKTQKEQTLKSEDKAQKEKTLKSEDKTQREQTLKSEDKAQKEKTLKRTNSDNVLSKSKRYCTVPQTTATCDCQLCDSTPFESMDADFIVYNASLAQKDSDAMDVTESYEELVDNESAWRKTDGQTLESHLQEMRAFVPKTKRLSPNESDDVIIEEFTPEDPQPLAASGSPAISGQECAEHSPNVGFIMTDLTKSDMDIFSLWNEEVMRRAAEQQKLGQSRQTPDDPLQMVVAAREPKDCQGCAGASAGNPPETFVLQVISFDSPSVTYSEGAVLNCDPGQQAVTHSPPNDTLVPANASPQNQADPFGAVSVTSLSYGVFKLPQ